MSEKVMLRAPGPPPTQDQARLPWGKLRQVHLDPGSHPSQPENYPGNGAGGVPDVVARAAVGGARPLERGPRGRCAGTIETWLGWPD